MAHVNITLHELDFVFRTNLSAGRWQPTILLGAPGSGKTSYIVHQLRALYAGSLGLDADEVAILIEKPARRDAAEIAGVALPSRDDDGEVFTAFSMSPVIKAIERTGSPYGILLWDEIAAARDPEQKVCADSFDPREHAIGGHKLPDGWIVIGTGNRAADKAGSSRLMAHLTNRAMVFNIIQDVAGLARWWQENGCNPVVIECAVAQADNGFFADRVPIEDGPYCTPRSLEEASHHLNAFMASAEFQGFVPPLMERMLAANIGAAAARTLAQWIAQRDQVPSADEILRDPLNATVPEQTGFQMIAANIAMAEVRDHHSATAVLHYILRLRTDLRVPMAAKLLRKAAVQGWIITDSAAVEFISQHHELLPLVG
jgi:hypothetical protein